MKTYVVLFRGINVGGKNKLPMKLLVPILEQHGFQNVSYYIQSGNLVLAYSSDPTEEIKQLVQQHFDISPDVLVLEKSLFLAYCEDNPYPEGEGKSVHFYFCASQPQIDQTRLNKWQSSSEHYQVKNQVFYLSAPDGIGRSKLVANIESCLGCSATGRNLNTVNKLRSMLEGVTA